jgi:hypothetical protein
MKNVSRCDSQMHKSPSEPERQRRGGRAGSILERRPVRAPREQFLILVECRSEEEQVRLLRHWSEQGMTCRALLS